MRESARVVGRVVERRLLTPSLVRETSRTTGAHGLRRRAARALGLLPAEETGLSGIVLNKDLTGRVQETAVATSNTKRNGAPFRHMLFYGPPGTGKTMVAKRLARTSGLDYAIMSGGDIGPLGKDGVTELHKLLDWGETSGRGLLLFIDEADAFLSSRSRAAMSEDHRNALNALLYRTGEASRNMMMVLATNRPGDLDAAINDRVDDAMLFGLPDAQAREELLKIYFEKMVVRAGEDAPRKLGVFPSGAAKIRVEDGFDDEYFKELAHRTAGFSGRAISKLMLGVQGTVYGRKVPSLSLELMEEVVQRKLVEFDERKAMAVDASRADFTDSAADSITGGEAAAKARKSASAKSAAAASSSSE
jgi:ATPase family AAA domain-containing protein 3A/B